jgi:hypothetical protein
MLYEFRLEDAAARVALSTDDDPEGARGVLEPLPPADCAPRPLSQIAVDGPFATGSDWTIPGSAGDTCTRGSHGRVVFVSRLYQAPNKPTVRVRIVLAQFKGLGLYRTLPQAATDAGPAQVSVIVGIGIHGRRLFLGQASVVTATSSTPTTLGGRFHATILGPKQTRRVQKLVRARLGLRSAFWWCRGEGGSACCGRLRIWRCVACSRSCC